MGTRSLRRAVPAAFAALIVVGAGAAPAHAASRLIVVGMPLAEAQRFAETHPGRLGLGVFPDSRDAGGFVREISYGAPRSADPSAQGGRAGALGRSLTGAGLSIGIESSGPPAIASALAAAFAPDPSYPSTTDREGALKADVAVLAAATASEADELLRDTSATLLLLGIGERTPVWIEICEGVQCVRGGRNWVRPGLLDGGIARRPGIVTPYDLAATILDLAGVRPPERFAGRVMRSEDGGGSPPVERTRTLAARLERDASLGSVIGATPVTLAVLGLGCALLLLAAGRRGAATRVAQGAALVFPGFPIALFLPTGRGELRGLAIAGVFAAGAAIRPRLPLRTIARIGLAAAVAFAILAAVAPLRPGGEPALSIWGNPLTSWRFFGLQNVEASLVASGPVVWAVLAGLGLPVIVALAAGAGLVIGMPSIGANFVGVLTFAFGATLALLALRRRRVEPWHPPVAAGVAIAAFAGALLADAGSPVSHGGRAVSRVSEGGLDAALDLIRGRLALNAELIGDFFGGWIVVAMLAAAIVALLVWSARVWHGPVAARAAVWGGAAMALASLALEDSGFYSGATLWFAAASAWLLTLVRSEGVAGPMPVSSPVSGAPPGAAG
jgi:hypothetical protein